MSALNIALEILARKDAFGEGFFDAAAEALARGLDCRWAGVGILRDDGKTIDIAAFWEDDGLKDRFSYDLKGSPCEGAYDTTVKETYCFFPDKVQEYFPFNNTLQTHGVVSYRAEVVFKSSGAPCAHIFVAHDDPQSFSQDDMAFFRLVAQRAGAELNRLRAEASLREAKDAAEAASRSKSQFIAHMSHELRTPLNCMIGFSELILREHLAPLHPAHREYMQLVYESGQHLLSLINDVLDIARIEANGYRLNEAEADLEVLIKSCVSMMSLRARQGNIELTLLDSERHWDVLIDERVVKQVVINLLSNAIKFTHAGGKVTIALRAGVDGGVAICVADTGIGIHASDLDKALSYFGQVHSGTTREYEGAGIGLPLSKRMMELHGGTLELQSDVGQGTVVTATLPARCMIPARSVA